ncbi:MAG: NusG domain II-containing protein, partial [Candidatus Cloacimonetes bacterium]|nr:NusG domain II-containing protein [Candidatus Cloacimonadota bacterium]
MSDVILIGVLIILAVLSLAIMKKNSAIRMVTVYHRNQLVYQDKINKDKILELEPGVVVEINRGRVRMQRSTCREQFCVKQGWSSFFPIICVPNQILIRIREAGSGGML